ncbi:hypothetical protein VE00_02294 [Pseudogymnoascus sp. WSF 3629]|nr:hypothetical protein VE00_02294 [Pseudogymnoascus sp. WSF 3629]
MAGASDKVRFYMEQAVPQLREFEEKKIFTKDEIRSLVKKRSDFEHLLLARGCPPPTFARYAAWESNLERLRASRCQRLRIKSSSSHTGQARVLAIFARGTRKHPGDLGLWMTYLEYARTAGATSKFKVILTAALRLHCTVPGLWVYAARCALEESDMGEARSFLQRGARFCNQGPEMWVQYAKLEMIFLAKIAARRRVLGLDAPAVKAVEEKEVVEETQGFEGDEIKFPEFKAQSLGQSAMEGVKVDGEAKQDPMNTPALQGAIPLAIFDDAAKQAFFSAEAAQHFFDMFTVFTQVGCLPKVLQHVLDVMMERFPTEAATWDCCVRMPLVGVSPLTAEFPGQLAVALGRLGEGKEKVRVKGALAKKTAAWVEKVLAVEGLDEGIKTVLEVTLRKLEWSGL